MNKKISEQVKGLRLFAEKSKCFDRMVDAKIFKDAADTIEELSAKLAAANREKLTAYHDEKAIKISDDIRKELIEQHNKAFKLLTEMPLEGNEVWHGYVSGVMQTLGFLIDNIDSSDSQNPDRS